MEIARTPPHAAVADSPRSCRRLPPHLRTPRSYTHTHTHTLTHSLTRARTHVRTLQFVSRYISTIGIDFGVKPVRIGEADVRVNFWDLSGHPEFFEVRNEFYKDTQGGILVYDAGSKRSFEALEGWLRESAKFGGGDVPLVVCANKVDKRRAVSEAEGRAWAEGRGFPYFETSAESGANVSAAFEELFKQAWQQVSGK